jgi:hypothetical protein
MQFNHGLVIIDNKVLDMQLRAFRKHFVELGESARNEVRLRVIVTGQWVGTLHDPINVIGDVGKKFRAVTTFQALENPTNIICCNCHNVLSFFFFVCYFKIPSVRKCLRRAINLDLP